MGCQDTHELYQKETFRKIQTFDYCGNKISSSMTGQITGCQLNIDVNEAKYTYDGIDICGERAAQQVRNNKKKRMLYAENDNQVEERQKVL